MTKVITINSNDLNTFKTQLTEALNKGQATVTFTKKDGTERVMKCTTNQAYSPATTSSSRVVNPEVLPVYDIDAGGWRSFRWDSVKSAEVEG